MIRKKRWIFIAGLCVGFCLIACGKPDDPKTESYEVKVEPIVEDTEEEAVAKEKEEAEAVKGEPVKEEEPEQEDKETLSVSFIYEENSGSSPKEDQTHSYTYSYTRPVITIAGNESAAQRIQESIDAQIDRFLMYVKGGELGEVFEDAFPIEPAYDNLGVVVMRADEKVVSLQFMDEGYNGGAHGWANVSYRNYFTSTGEEITFADLGEGFREKAMELVRQKADEMQAKEPIFFGDYEESIPLVVLDGTEDMNAVHASVYDWWSGEDDVENAASTPTYYITEDGFVFVSGQYVLQPYACGIVDFVIPYEDFGDAYTGNIF